MGTMHAEDVGAIKTNSYLSPHRLAYLETVSGSLYQSCFLILHKDTRWFSCKQAISFLKMFSGRKIKE